VGVSEEGDALLGHDSKRLCTQMLGDGDPRDDFRNVPAQLEKKNRPVRRVDLTLVEDVFYGNSVHGNRDSF
jgi:hypothetical protein